MTDPSPLPSELRARAEDLLRELAGPEAVLRRDQAAALGALVVDRARVLVVQRTGWGKSAVYFLATRLLRDAGAGPTLLVSPLLALMRDQIAAAGRAGVRAATVNSANREDWDEVTDRVRAGDVDLLLVSPERLNHPRFRRELLPGLSAAAGLLVVDEAHCVSDWGHDFRPDYRRIVDVVAGLAEGTPVLATTATANDRVVADVATQLGASPLTLRGSLDRSSLHLSVRDLRSDADRLAWLEEWVAATEGSGIVYCLTVADTERVARWLASRGIDAVAYSSAVPPEDRQRIEDALGDNAVKAVVSTTALGMGYDKPDLAWVVHYGMPSSPVAYYQMIGRAGRALDRAEVVLLPGRSDEAVWAWFEATALPPEAQVRQVLDALATEPLSTQALERAVNLSRGRLEATLKILDVDGAVERVDGGWRATGAPWAHDEARLAKVAEARRAEQDAMRAYARGEECLLASLRAQLDDPDAAPCGRCSVCTGVAPGLAAGSPATRAAAQAFLREQTVRLTPRRRWPARLANAPGGKAGIPRELQAAEGRALAEVGDGGWSALATQLVEGGGDDTEWDEAMGGVLATLKAWEWDARPTWVTWVPFRPGRPQTAQRLATHIAEAGRLPLLATARRDPDRPPQAGMANSTQQARNALAAYEVGVPAGAPPGPCLLVDDAVASGWTLTVLTARLRASGVSAVLPFALLRTR